MKRYFTSIWEEGVTYTITSNKSKRTYTIKKYDKNWLIYKIATPKLSKDEFNNCDYFTITDWYHFIKRCI